MVGLGGGRVILVKMCLVIIWDGAQADRAGDTIQPELSLNGSGSMAWHGGDTGGNVPKPQFQLSS